MINVILADHERVFRVGMASVLAAEDDIRIVGQHVTPEKVIYGLARFRPHVLVMSSAFLGFFEAIRAACNQQRTAILLVQDYGSVEQLDSHGDFQGVVTRAVDEATIVMYIHQLARGGSVVRVTPHRVLAAAEDTVGMRVRRRLNPYELEIIANVVRGYKNREIAARMGISEHAVKNGLRKIFDKMGVYDRLELALFVVHHGTLGAADLPRSASIRSLPFPMEPRMWASGRGPTIQ